MKDVEQALARDTRSLSWQRDFIEDKAHVSIPLAWPSPHESRENLLSQAFLSFGWLPQQRDDGAQIGFGTIYTETLILTLEKQT
jgi:hypothetical protein